MEDSLFGKILGVLFGLLLLYFIVRIFISNVQLILARRAASKNPTQENAWKVYKILCKFGVGIENHPKEWGKFRDMFYKINCSPDVPTEIKENLKARLVKKGLYINNMKIIDNYKNKKNSKEA